MTDGTTPEQPGPEQRPPGWNPPPPPPAYGQPAYGQPAYAPPPGYGQAPPPYGQPPAYGQPAPYAPPPPGYPPLHQARPAYKPGTIPLRPLGLGDMYSGAIETVRRNPKATLGVAAVVLTVIMLIPSLVAVIWGALAGFGSTVASSNNTGDFTPEDIGLVLTTLVGAVLGWIATIVLTGMIVHVVEHAARGQKLSAGAAWKLTRSRVWRLIGLALVSLLLPVVVWAPLSVLLVAAFVASTSAGWVAVAISVLVGVPVTVLLYIRLVPLSPAILVLEQRGVFASMGRSWALTRGQFWRVFGIVLLTLLVTSVASQILSFPFGLLSVVATLIWPDTLAGILVGLLAQNVATVIAGTVTTPFSAAVVALQYLDQRIRKEGYDIELISRVAAPASAGPTYGMQ